MNFMLRQFSKISIVIKHIGSFNVTSVSNTQVQPGEHKLMVLQDITAQHRGRDLLYVLTQYLLKEAASFQRVGTWVYSALYSPLQE